MWNKPLPRDKVLHFIGGYLITHVTVILFQLFGPQSEAIVNVSHWNVPFVLNTLLGLLAGTFFAVILSFIKEELDRRSKGKRVQDSNDILAGVLGSASFSLATFIGLTISIYFYV